ncbi:MAG: 30S ribosomal protein S13 [Candidatus Yanofskybacteria bacterium CG10_big_fil_rev_8_21_14_0_10_46_23]|uniref:Small ribosomal subunit protein uS13 n=1 Tax=Candidatus Yanofskybacteria bacterium CG10_big_fil_rev_8_21_14_0_10_46_23 TaxID=1975098 RepID=A0A2H0R4Q1_9BACT|nr:MAG: 30S ribosomal protein S13 [Candidatus Yanofskybacteria bacterium CG10_big_fil_rev_8_21_14_0_10_46_23]
MAVRISGVNIPEEKRIEIALTYVFGIGNVTSNIILKTAKIDPNKRTKDLTADEVSAIQGVIDRNYTIEGDLRREITNSIKRLRDINTWRGSRHTKKLPIHGRSKTNSRTIRGNVRRSAGSGRKPTAQKT